MQLFDEPKTPRTAWLGSSEPAVRWYSEATRDEAVASRGAVNTWYASFPDSDGIFAARLRSENDIDHRQALDELFIHQLLRKTHPDIRYEEGGVGPDFRVYETGSCVAAVEVASLFMRTDWASRASQHDRLADEVNRRVRPTAGYFLDFDIESAPNDPAPRHFAQFVKRELESLPPHELLADISPEDVPACVYERNGVRIRLRFLPMKPDAKSKLDPEARIVGIGPMTVGMVNSGSRISDVVGKKGGERYELGSYPYLVAVGVHDPMASDDVIFDGLYGGEAVQFTRDDPDNYTVVRRNDGLFGADRERTTGRHRRISGVVTFRYFPGGPNPPQVTLYENPFAHHAAPEVLIGETRRFGRAHDEDGGDFIWRDGSPPGAQAP
ncbi:hypothetical protein [Ilumatobacter sp.]|uniref:hypothetical protein n=1 Tax=Ilumatobacter sp. TaxID=1967498 RepID=UPI003C375D11